MLLLARLALGTARLLFRLLALRPLAPGVDPMFITAQASDALASSGDADAAPIASASATD
jgi:hypothetical protein